MESSIGTMPLQVIVYGGIRVCGKHLPGYVHAELKIAELIEIRH
jgi:hypothetical protein